MTIQAIPLPDGRRYMQLSFQLQDIIPQPRPIRLKSLVFQQKVCFQQEILTAR
jgi:hypothetical protein